MNIKIAVMRDNLPFAEAFRIAREAGADEFEWRLNRYHTKRMEEVDLTPPSPAIVGWKSEPSAGLANQIPASEYMNAGNSKPSFYGNAYNQFAPKPDDDTTA